MTKIEWTHRPGTKGERWNPIKARNKKTDGIGHFCTKVSKGCNNCYAANFQPRFKNPIRYAKQDTDQVEIFLDKARLREPLHWKKPRTAFVCSMTDLFLELHPDDWLDQIFAHMALCVGQTFMVLTKRPARAQEYLRSEETARRIGKIMRSIDPLATCYMCPDQDGIWPLPNVWLGVSVEDQATADERIPILLNTPAELRFISAEPLLGPLQIERWLNIAWQCSGCRGYFSGAWQRTCPDCGKTNYWCGSHKFNGRKRHKNPIRPPQSGQGLDWVIVGGESGHKANPMHPDWARSLRNQCNAANVPFFFKQWGNTAPLLNSEPVFTATHHLVAWPDGTVGPGQAEDKGGPGLQLYRTTKKAAGRELDGMQHNTWPRAAA
ncbi:MAG: phage Gp37/Gp68 family protein [Thalassospira sp.]|nr:phage Gp37/Gp68 family protein [Thalassospira sp.]